MARYIDTQVLIDTRDEKAIPIYRTVRYPEVPVTDNDIYVITTVGDRLDLLAADYYGDVTLYWIISAANNNLPQDSLSITPGTQIRIPVDVSETIMRYNLLNRR